MTLRVSNAFRSILRQLGIVPTIEGILDVLGAGFDFTFPDQVEVQMATPDPPEHLDEAAAAYAALEQGHTRGKLVVTTAV